MPAGFQIVKDFESGKCVHLEDLKHMANHICGNLNNWTPNYRFWYNMYSYSSKAYIVCRWRQSRSLSPVAKWGEAICEDNLVNFFKDENHKNCSCSSVYYKQFFFICRKCLMSFFPLRNHLKK